MSGQGQRKNFYVQDVKTNSLGVFKVHLHRVTRRLAALKECVELPFKSLQRAANAGKL